MKAIIVLNENIGAIVQPYLFPYLPYYALYSNVEIFIFLDDVVLTSSLTSTTIKYSQLLISQISVCQLRKNHKTDLSINMNIVPINGITFEKTKVKVY